MGLQENLLGRDPAWEIPVGRETPASSGGQVRGGAIQTQMEDSQTPEGAEASRGVPARDSYMILEVKPISDLESIKSSYRELAKRYHPDLNPDKASAGRKIQEIKRAYDQVGTPEARRVYDLQRYFQWRVPAELGKLVTAGGRRKPEPKVGLWGRIVGVFSKKAAAAQARQHYRLYFSAGLTCAQVPGGKLLEEAELDFAKALEFNPAGAEALYNLGLALYQQGKYAEALERFQGLTRLNPRDAGARKMVELLTPP